MRRALIGGGCGPGFAVNLTINQHRHTAGQQGNVAFLPRHHVRQVFDRPGQVGDAFFQGGLIGHPW